MAMRTLIIVPAFNEERNLPLVAKDLGPAIRDAVVIDDGSTDRTAAVARELGFQVVRLPYNMGIGGAVQTGFKFALKHGYDAAVQFDGDHQHCADQIDRITEPVRQGLCDLSVGSRILAGGYDFPFLRRVGGLWFSFLLRLLGWITVSDPTSGFRCYGRKTIEFFAATYPDDYPEVESTLLAAKFGLRVMDVPSRMRQRHAGESSIHSLLAVYYMIKVSLSLLIAALKGNARKTEDVFPALRLGSPGRKAPVLVAAE
jgi:glycosyltransferase involved in cell wall biosynthesis